MSTADATAAQPSAAETPPAERARVAVVGAGAIGSYVAGLAARAGHDVTLCVRTPFERLRVEKDGETREVQATIATGPSGLEPADWVVVATKAQDTPGVEPWLRQLAGPDTTVVVAQNGVSHRERVQPLAPDSEILPALVYITVEPVERGHVRHSVGNRIVVPAGPAAERFAALMTPSGVEIEQDDDFVTAAWRKFLGNVAGNPITALTLRRAEVFRDEGIGWLAGELLDEAIAIGRAEGANWADDEKEQTLELFRSIPGENGTSMLFDRLAGRPLEYELISGYIVEAGRRHGIATPANRVVLALIAALDEGLRGGSAAQ